MWRHRCDYVDSKSMSFDIKVVFGNCSVVCAPALLNRYPVNASESGNFNSGCENSGPFQP